MATTLTSWLVAGTVMFTCRLLPSSETARLHETLSHHGQSHTTQQLHFDQLTFNHQLPRNAFGTPQGNSPSASYTLLLFTSGTIKAFSHSHSPVLGGFIFLFSFLFIIFQRKPAQKTIRPQARPRAKESVMIPTLLMMNITNLQQQQHQLPTTATKTAKHNYLLRWLWFFLLARLLISSFVLSPYSFCLFYCVAWKRRSII